jgi:hypothetical protein
MSEPSSIIGIVVIVVDHSVFYLRLPGCQTGLPENAGKALQ